MTARHDKAACDCKDGGHDDGTGRCLCGGAIHRVPVGGVVHRVRDETRTATHDKATEGRTEAAAVDQAIADVRAGLAKGCTCGKTNHDLRGFDIDAYHDENDCRLCAALAALRVLADAVEELRLSLYSRDILLSLANGRLEAAEAKIDEAEAWLANETRRRVAAEAERDRRRDEQEELSRLTGEALDERDRLARQVADLSAALRPFVEEYDFHAADYLADRVDGEEARVLTARTVEALIEHQRAGRAALATDKEQTQ